MTGDPVREVSALSVDELRGELRDPATSTPRLMAMFHTLQDRFGALFEWLDDPAIGKALDGLDVSAASRPLVLSMMPAHGRESLELLGLMAIHPNLPLPGVRLLLLRTPSVLLTEPWFNPNVPLLLLSEPLPQYLEAATLALHEYAPLLEGRPSLASQVASWHWMAQHPDRTEHEQRAIAFARHLASLFGLPWPAA